MTELNKNNIQSFIGLRAKILVPLILGGFLLLFAAISILQNALTTATENVQDTKLAINVAYLTHNNVEFQVRYKKRFIGVFDGFSVVIRNDDVFNFNWANTKETLEQQHHGVFFAGGYVYSPQKHAFVLVEQFKNDNRFPRVIDNSHVDCHSGMGAVDSLLKKGACRFTASCKMPDHKHNISWLAIAQRGTKVPRVILIGTGMEQFEGLIDYLSILEGIAILVIISIVLVIIWNIISRSVNRVREAKDYLVEVATGNLPDRLLKIHSKDEFEEIATVINDMVTELKEKQKIEAELNTAANIQLAMLPKNFTNFSNGHFFDIYASIRPARKVGGDFYDFFMPDENHLAIAIADVSGKGVPAALYMVLAKIILRGSVQPGVKMSDTMTNVNRVLLDYNEYDYFITVWVGLLDLTTGELTFCNAGHNPPLLKHNGKHFKFLEEINGTVMGFLRDVEFTQGKIRLEQGDMLALYTDGVIEAQNEEGDPYGEDKLVKLLDANSDLSSKEMVLAVKEEVDTFVGTADQFDDMTILVLEYLG